MKILFNNLPLYDNYTHQQRKNTQVHKNSENNKPDSILGTTGVSSVYFCARPDSTMLLAQSDKLLCAYSRKPMLSPYVLRSIFAKLAKKTNAQSAINFLKEYREYMPSVETEIFDMFEEYKPSGKTTFQDILTEKRPEALARLRQKQTEVLHSADDYILSLDEILAEELLYIRDVALLKVDDGTFGRSEVLEQLQNIKTDNKNKNKIHEVYKKWYALPRALKDYDAFIVKYSKFSHNDIAQRLLNMAAASVEHIKPYADGGKDCLANYVLTLMIHNLDKGDMNLADYDELNSDIEIKKNLPKYIDDVCSEIKHGNSYFAQHYTYPADLRRNVIAETGWKSFMPELNISQLSGNQKQIQNSRKGANRYRYNHK